jgi:gliding motility-associatede transport system auxiliary component
VRSLRPSKLQLRLVNAVFMVLFLLALMLLQWLSENYHWRFDWTSAARNSLSPASVAALKSLDKPVTVTAYASERPNLRKGIRELFERYQKHKSDIALTFINPDTDPESARRAGVRFDGEVVVQCGEAKENLDRLDEESITNALVRLGHHGERWLVFISGHGERNPDTNANFDLSLWAEQLRKRGFATRVLNLAENPQIPQNTAALVIAGPRVGLLPGEVKLIEKYLADGGNLLWLGDPQPLYGLEPVAEMLGVEFLPGVVVDPASEQLTGNASAIVVTHYSNHPTVRNFRNVTLFPSAAAIALHAPAGWKAVPLLTTRAEAWSETGALGGSTQFDKNKDIAGPLDIGVALTRDHDQMQQRVVVIGDGDFLSNRFLGNGINLDLGLSIVNWVTRDDAYVSIPVSISRDRTLQLTTTSRAIIGGGLLFLLPLLLIASGTFVWLRRRRR